MKFGAILTAAVLLFVGSTVSGQFLASSVTEKPFELYGSKPLLSIEEIHFTEEEILKFTEELRIERETATIERKARLQEIYEPRMAHIRLQAIQAVPEDFVQGLVINPTTGKQVYQFFDANFGVIRVLSLEEGLYFVLGAIIAFITQTLKDKVLDKLQSMGDMLDSFIVLVEDFIYDYNNRSGPSKYSKTMENCGNTYEILKKLVREVLNDKIKDGIKDAVVYAAKTYLGINFLVGIGKILWRIGSNIFKITDYFSDAYQWYSIADSENEYFYMGASIGSAAQLVFV